MFAQSVAFLTPGAATATATHSPVQHMIRYRLHHPFTAALVLTLFSLSGTEAQTIDPGSSGTLYFVAFPDTVGNDTDPRFSVRRTETATIVVFSDVEQEVSVTGPSTTRHIRLQPRVARELDIEIVTSTSTPQFTVASIRGTRPFLVTCFYTTRFGTEAFTPLAAGAFGRKYVVASLPGEVVRNIEYPVEDTIFHARALAANAQLTIVCGTPTPTHVTVLPRPGVSLVDQPEMPITMLPGQAITLRAVLDTASNTTYWDNGDPTLTEIISDGPIGVIAGNPRGAFGLEREVSANAGNTLKNSAFEWLTPVDMHGTSFVHLPVSDTLAQIGNPGDSSVGKRAWERILFVPSGYTPTSLDVLDSGASAVRRVVPTGRTDTSRWRIARPHLYRSNRPAQAFVYPAPVIEELGRTTGTLYHGESYRTYGGFSVEMVPREQWTSFAPIYAPTSLTGVGHYVNIVADSVSARTIFDETGQLVDFNRGSVPGTDLVWGSFPVPVGRTMWIEGRGGARFYATQYGLEAGFELYRPGFTTRRKEGTELLGTVEYEEMLGRSYGLALAPRRLALQPPDSIAIRQTFECRGIDIDVTFVNSSPSGIRSLVLADGSSNAAITTLREETVDAEGRVGMSFLFALVDPDRPATGTVIIEDRTGHKTAIPLYRGSNYARLPSAMHIDFGVVPYGSSRDFEIPLFNDNDDSLRVWSAHLTNSSKGFRLLFPSNMPLIIPPHDSTNIIVRVVPPSADWEGWDTLVIGGDHCGNPTRYVTGRSSRVSAADIANSYGGRLGPVAPTPSRSTVSINYTIPRRAHTTMRMFDIRGNVVRTMVDTVVGEGEHEVRIDVSTVPKGLYLVRLQSGLFQATNTLVVVHE